MALKKPIPYYFLGIIFKKRELFFLRIYCLSKFRVLFSFFHIPEHSYVQKLRKILLEFISGKIFWNL